MLSKRLSFSLMLFFVLLAFSGWGRLQAERLQPKLQETASPNPQLEPSPGASITPAPSLTPSPSPAPTLGVGESFAERLRIGRGAVLHAEWHPDGERVLVDTIQGAWLYKLDADSYRLSDEAYLPEARLARFSPDGRWIAGVDAQQKITLWDANSYALTQRFEGHEAYVMALEWHPASDSLASLDREGHIMLWDMAAGQLSQRLDLDSADQIRWSPQGSYLAAIDFESGVIQAWKQGKFIFRSEPAMPAQASPSIMWRREGQLLQRDFDEIPRGILWDIESGVGTEFKHVGYANAYNPEGSVLATTQGRGTTILVDAETGMVLFPIHGPENAFILSWSPDGNRLASGDWSIYPTDKTHVFIADSATGTVLQDSVYEFSIKQIAWSANSEDYLVVDVANQIFINGYLVSSTLAHTDIGKVAAWRPDGQMLAIADTNQGARLWDALSGSLIDRIGLGQVATKLAWQPGGHLLALAGGNYWQSKDNNLYLWDTDAPPGSEKNPIFIIPHVNPLISFEWRPDGAGLASLEKKQYLRWWQVDKPRFIETFDTYSIRLSPYIDYTRQYHSMRWRPDGHLLSFSSSSSGGWGSVHLFDVDEAAFIEGNTPPAYASTWIWTADNRFLWASWGRYGNVPRIQDISLGGDGLTEAGQEALLLSGLGQPLDKNEIVGAQFSPDARWILGYDRVQSIVWDVQTQSIISQFEAAKEALWSPDSSLIAILGLDGLIRIVDPQSGETVHLFRQHFQNQQRAYEDWIEMIWSPDSQQIALLDQGVLFMYDRFYP